MFRRYYLLVSIVNAGTFINFWTGTNCAGPPNVFIKIGNNVPAIYFPLAYKEKYGNISGGGAGKDYCSASRTFQLKDGECCISTLPGYTQIYNSADFGPSEYNVSIENYIPSVANGNTYCVIYAKPEKITNGYNASVLSGYEAMAIIEG